ncbi:MAG TPA: kelch repeat-containing protein, partial [Polyangium sp.]|nr:kelch repeat-containing protein [Polyangium sp.]
MTNQDGRPVSTEAESPELGASGNSAARDVVLAVRGRLERANLPMGNPLSDNSRSVPGSLELLGASAFAETTKAASANGLLASPKFKTSVVLASHANGAFRVTDDRSRLSVDVSLRGATNATREDVGGYSVYRSAYAHGAHIMHRTSEQGTEDYVFFPDEVPAAAELRYDIALSDDVAGLRLVSNTLEMLDKGGTPRLRMNPPYAVDGDGNAVTLDVAVEGCAYDSSGAMPWTRPTVDPKSRQCTVRLTWDGSVKAPLVVDPQWVHTANEITPRVHMSATVIGNKVVVAGGDNANGAGATTVFDTVESYDPDTMTWTAGPKMPGPRTDHSAVLLNINGKSFLYVMGGRNVNGECMTEVIKMDLSNGGWLPGVNMPVALAKHTSTVFPDQRVLLTGGISSGSPSPVSTTLLYNPVGPTWNKTLMMSARADHTATLVHDKYVLVAGGRATTFLDSM